MEHKKPQQGRRPLQDELEAITKFREWIRTEEHANAFNQLKEGFTKIPCLAHYNAQSEVIITTDAFERNRSVKTYSARLTRWLDRLAPFRYKHQTKRRKTFSANRLFEQISNIRAY